MKTKTPQDSLVLFMEPLVPRSVTYGRYEKAAGNNTFPVGIASIARYIHDRGYTVDYLDPALEQMDEQAFKAFLLKTRPAVIGIGSTTLQVEFAYETFKLIKSTLPDTLTVLGGIHATLMPKEVLEECEYVDLIITGEGEKPFLAMLESEGEQQLKQLSGLAFKDRNNELVLNAPNQKSYLAPEEIPVPLFDIFPMRQYIAQITFAKDFPTYTVVTARGCPFKCSFCNATEVMGRNIRRKSPETVIEEMRILKEEYGAKGIMFLDSTFTIQHSWVNEFCQKYIQSGLNIPWSCCSRVDTLQEDLLLEMKKAGCWSLAFGIESGNQKSLDFIKKGTTVEQNEEAIKLCLDNGLNVLASYIICLPGETADDVLNTLQFAKKLGSHLALFYLPVPFPKTRMANDCAKTGIVRSDARWSEYNSWDFSKAVYINPLIGKEGMHKLLRKCFLHYYITPTVLWRNLKELLLLRQSPRKYWLAFRGFISSLR